MVSAKVKVGAVGVVGVGTGIAIPTLAAEFTSRATGQTAWRACGVKGLVKGIVGAMAYAISGRVGESAAMFAEMFAYTSWGSWVIDVALAAYPGGLTGLAEDWASSVRVYTAGGRRVVKELGVIEMKTAGQTSKASAVF